MELSVGLAPAPRLSRPFSSRNPSSSTRPSTIMPGEAKLKTTPLDPRFPNQNQAQHCWTRYNEFVLCLKNNDNDEDSCKKYFQYASSLCPNSWMERWNEQREEGTFQGVQYFKEE